MPLHAQTCSRAMSIPSTIPYVRIEYSFLFPFGKVTLLRIKGPKQKRHPASHPGEDARMSGCQDVRMELRRRSPKKRDLAYRLSANTKGIYIYSTCAQSYIPYLNLSTKSISARRLKWIQRSGVLVSKPADKPHA